MGEWYRQAACAHRGDIPSFDPDQRNSLLIEKCKQVCRTCPVRIECLSYAIANHVETGIWGGQTYEGRRNILAFISIPTPYTEADLLLAFRKALKQ